MVDINPRKIGKLSAPKIDPKTASKRKKLPAPIDRVVTGLQADVKKIDKHDKLTKLVILHTNDMHGHIEPSTDKEDGKAPQTMGGIDNLAATIDRERNIDPHATLLLDAGDVTTGAPVADYYHAKPMFEAMNEMGYDAMTLGNHEVDMGLKYLRQNIETAKFPVLSANMIDYQTGEKKLDVQKYVIKEVGDKKVGVLGLTTPMTVSMLKKEDQGRLEFTSAAMAAEMLIPQMKREGADLVVVLSHLGIESDRKLAKEIDDIDVIIGGHSHTDMERHEKIGDTIIQHAECFGRKLGKLELIFDETDKNKIKDVRSKVITVEPKRVKPDSGVSKIVGKYKKELEKTLNREVGEAGVDLTQPDYHLRKEESNIANFVADTMREKAKTDIAILSPSTIRADISKGKVKVGDVYRAIPPRMPGTKLAKVKIKGEPIKIAMEQLLSGPANGLAVSGMKTVIDTSKPKGERIVSVTMADGKPMEDDRYYTVATRDFYAYGNLGVTAFHLAEEVRVSTRQKLTDIVIQALERKKLINPKKDGRLVNLDKREVHKMD